MENQIDLSSLGPLSRRDAISQIETAISSMHVSNRTVGSAYGTSLGLVESTILAEVSGGKEDSPSALAQALMLSQVQISRAIDRMERERLVQRKADAKDGRRVSLAVTAQGKKVFFNAYKEAQRTFEVAYARLSSEEGQRFSSLMDAFADGLGAPAAVRLVDDPPMMNAIRRITRGLGFLSQHVYWFKELDPLCWQILRKLVVAGGAGLSIIAKDICAELGVRANTLSLALKRMQQRSLIEKKVLTANRRESVLSCTKSGVALYEECRAAACALLTRALAGLSDADLSFFAHAWPRYAACELVQPEAGVGAEFRFVSDLSEQLRYKARQELLLWYFGQESINEMPGLLLHKTSFVSVLLARGAVAAVVEISGQEIVHAALCDDSVPRLALRNFAEYVKRQSGFKFSDGSCPLEGDALNSSRYSPALIKLMQ